MTRRCRDRSGVGRRTARCGELAIIVLSLAALAGCGSAGTTAPSGGGSARSALERYLRQIEPIRLAVNRLLNEADPILNAYHERRLTPAKAAREMGELERRFAAYTVDVAAIQSDTPTLRLLHAEYAHTYILEDAYLSALVSGLAQHELADLPDTQAAQRAAIIAWRTGLTVLADQADVALPTDLQQAGRGEIAPSPRGS